MRERVLIVDDYLDSAELVRDLLESQGHDCRIAETGLAALAESYDFDPTVVILDIELGDIDGCEVVRRLRARPGGQRLFATALSGWSNEARKRLALDAGFDHFIPKPASTAKIRGILAAAQARA